MVVDGKIIAHELKNKILAKTEKLRDRLSLGIIVAWETSAIEQFVSRKLAFGKEVKVDVEVIRLDSVRQNNEELLQCIIHSSRTHDGLILQLPIPQTFDLEAALNLYPLSHDVDVLGNTAFQQYKEGTLPFDPPVIGAIAEIAKRNNVSFSGKKILIIGGGRLVGAPAAVWAERHLGKVTIADKRTEDLSSLTQDADIIVTGTGMPGLLKPGMVKEGAVLFDAGSGELAGKIVGDADQACAEKTSLFTPTPGGIGPITVAKVFENLLVLHEIRSKANQ